MTRIFSILILCICFIATGFSQVSIKEDFPIDMMMRRYSEINSSEKFIAGWRIQIIAKTDRSDIERAKKEFIQEFSGVSVDWTHSKPYYRLRAGAFLTKIEAIRMIQEIKKTYPGAFPVKDDISKEELWPES